MRSTTLLYYGPWPAEREEYKSVISNRTWAAHSFSFSRNRQVHATEHLGFADHILFFGRRNFSLMKMIAKLFAVCVIAISGAEQRVGSHHSFGAHHALQRGGFRGPLVSSAATPGFAAADGPPQPYSFSYDNTDEYGTQLFHNEQGDGNNAKTGSYGYRDANGLFRTVSYVADENGFRATVDTNEPGTAPGSSADAVFNAQPVANPVAAAASAPIGVGFARPGAGGGFRAGQFGVRGGASWSG